MANSDDRYVLSGKPGEIISSISYQPGPTITVTEIDKCIKAVEHLTDYINLLENRIEELENKDGR